MQIHVNLHEAVVSVVVVLAHLVPEMVPKDANLDNPRSCEEVEANGRPVMRLKEDHDEAIAEEDHDVYILEHRIDITIVLCNVGFFSYNDVI